MTLRSSGAPVGTPYQNRIRSTSALMLSRNGGVMPFTVYLLQVITKNDLEDTQNLTGEILRVMKRWCKIGMHAKRNIGFVIVTDESLQQLANRLWPDLVRLQELGRIERFFIHVAPEEVISDHGSIDALMHWLRAGRVEAWERNKPNNMRRRKRRERGV